MISRAVLVLQSNMHILKVEPCFPHPCNGIQDAEMTDVKEEGDPEPIMFPVMKSEDEVSCVCTCQAYFTNVEHSLLPFICPSACPYETIPLWRTDFGGTFS
jgi:hypothetical protein